MRTFIAVCLISTMSLSVALAGDSNISYVHYGDSSKGSGGTMGYWDDGGYAKNLLPMNLVDNGQSRLNYSAPQDNSTSFSLPDSTTPSDSLMFHSHPAAPSTPDNNQTSVQP